MKDKSGIAALACMVLAAAIGMIVTDADAVNNARAIEHAPTARTLRTETGHNGATARPRTTRNAGWPTYETIPDRR